MKINQLTQTDPIELARAVLTADDVRDFPIIHHAAVQLLDKLKQFEVEASYFEYDEFPSQGWCEPDDVAADSDCPFCGSVAGQQCSDITTNTEIASVVHIERMSEADETLVRDFAIGDRLELLDGRVGVLTHVGIAVRYLTADDGSTIPVHGNTEARLHVSK